MASWAFWPVRLTKGPAARSSWEVMPPMVTVLLMESPVVLICRSKAPARDAAGSELASVPLSIVPAPLEVRSMMPVAPFKVSRSAMPLPKTLVISEALATTPAGVCWNSKSPKRD